MYTRILKRDLKRKITMNIILFIFVILVTMFISGGVNNIVSVSNATSYFFDKAGVPDYWLVTQNDTELEKFKLFASENNVSYQSEETIVVLSNNVLSNGEKCPYSNTISLSSVDRVKTNIFDQNDKKITEVKEGEIFVTNPFLEYCDYNVGDKITVEVNSYSKTFTIAGTTKDALYGSAMIGQTRFLFNDKDFEELNRVEGQVYMTMIYVTTDDLETFEKLFLAAEIEVLFNETKSRIKMTYIMDLIVAAILLVVSIVLILIALIILRFTVVYTINDEFREIGVMKAIGIKNIKIRLLYMAKYIAISLVGVLVGFGASIPFSSLLLKSVSNNLMMGNSNGIWWNVISSILVILIVFLFTYFITRRIKKLSPLDAIRNGNNGERFKGKGKIKLSKSKLKPVWFISFNDILSNLKKYIILVITYVLGMLLIIIPINTINTLKSGNLLNWFSMQYSDICMAHELYQTESDKMTEEKVNNLLSDVKGKMEQAGYECDVFMEMIYKFGIEFNGNQTKSLAFQGVGDISEEGYNYIKGEYPKLKNEVAITQIIAKTIKCNIGDEISITIDGKVEKFVVTGYFQSMSNMGEGIRFVGDYDLPEESFFSNFAIQINVKTGDKEEALKYATEVFGEEMDVTDSSEYVDTMLGGLAAQLNGVRTIIVGLVIVINALVTILMMKSFISKEKGEIGMLKAIGFKNKTIIKWQMIRILTVLVVSIILALAISTPASMITSGQVFKMMGASSISFEIKPLEVFLLYPAIITATIVLASFVMALSVRKITALETSSIE